MLSNLILDRRLVINTRGSIRFFTVTEVGVETFIFVDFRQYFAYFLSIAIFEEHHSLFRRPFVYHNIIVL